MTPPRNTIPSPDEPKVPDANMAGGRHHRTANNRPRRKRVIAAAVSSSVVVLAIVAFVLVGTPLLEDRTVASPPETTPAPIVASTETTTAAPATEKTFPEFDRPDYVQLPVAETATEPVTDTTVTIGAETTGRILPEGLAGLSLDTDHLVDSYMNPDISNLDEILKMGANPVIRFGGQAADRRFFWTSTDEPIPAWPVVPAYKNDIRQVVKVTPEVLKNVDRLLEAGNARILLTANFGQPDAARTADLAQWAHKIFGDRLVGLSIGNEPNGWGHDVPSYYTLRDGSWSAEKYLAQVMPVAQAVAEAAPEVKIVGPDVYSEAWWKPYVKAGVPNLKALSYHNYPVSSCEADPSVERQARSIPNLMSRANADASRKYAEAAVAVAESANLLTRNTETNASSCGGSSAVTKNHASALWAVNYAMTSASVGVTMLNFHGGLEACKGGAPMSPLCDNGPYRNPSGVLSMRPGYFGLMMVNKMGSGDFMNAEVAGDENVYTYPIKHADGTMSVMVVNENDPTTKAPAQVTLSLPGQAATGTMSQMAAPSLDVEGLTRIDDMESAGIEKAEQARIPGFKAGQKSVTVPLNSGTATILNFTF